MMVVDSCKVKNGKLLLLLYSIKTRLECSAISVAAVAATTPPPSHRATSDQRRRRRRRWLMILYWQRANRGSRRKGTRKQVVLATRSGGGAVSITYIVVPPCNSATAGLYTISSTSQEMELAIRDQWRSGKVNIYIPSEIHGGRQPQIGTTTAI